MNTLKEASLLVILFCLVIVISSCSRTKNQNFMEQTEKIVSLVDQMKYQEALLQCDKFIESYPQSPFGYLSKGRIFKRLNRADEAVRFYREALVYINPNNHRDRAIYFGLIGDVYYYINELENALDYYDRALKEDPELSYSFMLDIARVYVLRGEQAKAHDIYAEVIKNINFEDQVLERVTEKNKGTIYGKAATVAFQLGKDRNALNFVEKYHVSHSNDLSRLFYSVYLAKLGYKEKARQEFKSINLQSCEPGALADYYLNIGDKQRAIDAFNMSYEQQKTAEQLKTWKIHWQQKIPRDVWNDVRHEEWFRTKVYM
jgi:tetratricopeptide (TPR) repeat protein